MKRRFSRHIHLCTHATFFSIQLSLPLNHEIFFLFTLALITLVSMKNIRLLLPGFFFIIVFGSCKKTSLQISSDLTDQWQWEYSIGGIAGQKIKPDNNSITLLNFFADSLFSVTKNGNPSVNGTYYTTTVSSSQKVIHFNSGYFGFLTGEAYLIENNELILTDYMISDGFRHYYKRIK